LSKPVAENPMIGDYTGGPECNGRAVTDTPGTKKWWFLAGTFGGAEPGVVRTCTMPVGRRLFFPVVNSVAFPFFPGETEENQREAAIEFINDVLDDPKFSMRVTVDGKDVKSKRIDRALSPVFSFTVPEDNIFNCPQCVPPFEVPEGEYDSASADGLWVTLPPLPPGEHKIRFVMSAPNVGVSQDNTYHLTVKRAKPAS